MLKIGVTMNWTIVLIAMFLAELFLSFTWNRYYFRFGIPIYVRRCEIGVERESDEIAKRLATVSSFSIKSLSDREIGIRERFGVLARGGVMHGVILLDSDEGTMKIIGYLDWVILLFGIALVVLRTWLAFPFLLILLALYGVAKSRFDKLNLTGQAHNKK